MPKQLPFCKTSDAIKGLNESELAKHEKNDCLVLSLASAFNVKYETAHNLAKNVFRRKDFDGAYSVVFTMDKFANTGFRLNKKWVTIMGDRVADYSNLYTMDYKIWVGKKLVNRKMTVGKFTELYETGTYIVAVRGHVFTIKDGVVIGNLEDSHKLKVIINNAWKIGK